VVLSHLIQGTGPGQPGSGVLTLEGRYLTDRSVIY